jgi:hypothetical protein
MRRRVLELWEEAPASADMEELAKGAAALVAEAGAAVAVAVRAAAQGLLGAPSDVVHALMLRRRVLELWEEAAAGVEGAGGAIKGLGSEAVGRRAAEGARRVRWLPPAAAAARHSPWRPVMCRQTVWNFKVKKAKKNQQAISPQRLNNLMLLCSQTAPKVVIFRKGEKQKTPSALIKSQDTRRRRKQNRFKKRVQFINSILC